MSISNTVQFAFSPLSFNLFDGVNWEEEVRKHRLGEDSDVQEPDPYLPAHSGSSPDASVSVVEAVQGVRGRRDNCAPLCTFSH